MDDCLKMYLVVFSEGALEYQIVLAHSYRIEGEHLVFLNENGELAALFLLEMVKRWSSMEIATA